ncbi:hypothetical protein RJ639_027860 [Escallonia herrerae]|uniref:Subtilisin-like protease fibronectin type-III domain-containing protein n=1 Tax=Escallonia herrerae TaxID=1293975 RepID=A0AA88X647_9ASTE|nr:hypothetical protein RJ639_027860 [Escallonia herrerae]
MAGIQAKCLFFFLSSCLTINLVLSASNSQITKKTYIVQMDRSAMPGTFADHVAWYSSMIQSVASQPNKNDDAEEERIIYSYQTAFHGVAARLSEEEVERLEKQHGVMAVFPETIYQLHTTRSPGQGLTSTQLAVFAKFFNRSCQHTIAKPGDLNYPAISAVFTENTNVSVMTLHRTVTNVGSPVSNYHVSVSPFKGVFVKVEPTTLSFTSKHQKLSYKVTFRTNSRQTSPESGNLIWKDGVHRMNNVDIAAEEECDEIRVFGLDN